MTLAVGVNDRVVLRDRPWRVRRAQAFDGGRSVLEVEALDADEPRALSVVVPPEELVPLPPEELRFERTGIESYFAWLRAHRLLAATLVRETGLLSGARFGRVAPEAYQLAPTLRLLAKPRPRLLVADDVGLGKTIEAGLAMLELAARGRLRRVLIVAPAGLVLQWKDELREKFGLAFTIIESAAGLARVQGDLPAGVNPWDVLPRVLTSVDYVKKEAVRSRAFRKRWDLIVVDEAHALAESGTPTSPYRTQRARLGAALREAADGLVLLTATPHNGYVHSFRSLLELVEPAGTSLHGDTEAIHRRVTRAMIRRMKSQIHRLLPGGGDERVFPRRHVKGMPVKLSGPELELLHRVASYCSRTARAAADTEDVDLVSFAMQIVKKRALSSRRALDQTVQHRLEALRKEEARETPPTTAEIRELQADLPIGDAAADRTARRVLRSAIPRDEARRKAEMRALRGIARLLRSLPARDPKVAALLGEIRRVQREDPSEKVIVFTEYLDTLDAIREAFKADRELRDRFVVLRGGMAPRLRRRVQREFETDEIRVLLATDAASEGLNLQHRCRRVIHVELPWNPNRLEQRNGRVDRYGQTREPEIRYQYYPGSPEDDVLQQLVEKIEKMAESRVSTPDILGVLAGADELDRGLVALDPEAADIESVKQSLVRLFDDRTADFVREVQPFLAAGEEGADGMKRLIDLLDTATPLLPEDRELEGLVIETLGGAAVAATGEEGLYRIIVPLAFRGPGVEASYRAATFRRDVAIRQRADEVEYMTPLHPLVQALAADARRRLLQVYPGERGLPPRRLAARAIAAGAPSVVFTFLGRIEGGGGLLEERLLAVQVDVTRHVVQADAVDVALQPVEEPGEVGFLELERLFGTRLEELTTRAREAAAEQMAEAVILVRRQRAEQARILRADLETDLADRLREIDEHERQARGLVEATGQRRLFSGEERGPAGFEARRAAAQAQAEVRRAEIDEFERVREPEAPGVLGALFLVPPGT